MNDSQAVCVGERVQHLLEDPGRVHRRQFPRTCQTRSKSFPLDVGHRVVQQTGAHPVTPRDLARIDEGQDVGVLEVRGVTGWAPVCCTTRCPTSRGKLFERVWHVRGNCRRWTRPGSSRRCWTRSPTHTAWESFIATSSPKTSCSPGDTPL